MRVIDTVHQLRSEEWFAIYTMWRSELFGPRWWGILALILFTYIVWWKLIDKQRLSHLLLFGSLISVLRVVFDDYVAGMGLYIYQTRLIPLTHALFLNDLTIIPLVYMLIYQFTSTWRSFVMTSAVFSGMWAFIVFPLFVMLGVIELYEWRYYYSFIAMLVIGIFTRVVFLLILRVEQGRSVQYAVGISAQEILQPALKPLHENREHQGHDDVE